MFRINLLIFDNYQYSRDLIAMGDFSVWQCVSNFRMIPLFCPTVINSEIIAHHKWLKILYIIFYFILKKWHGIRVKLPNTQHKYRISSCGFPENEFYITSEIENTLFVWSFCVLFVLEHLTSTSHIICPRERHLSE